MSVIDADTHVIEPENVFEHWSSDYTDYRPILTEIVNARTGIPRTHWVIGNSLVPKPEGPGAQFLTTPPVREVESGDGLNVLWKWRCLDDPVGRVADAKRYGVERQVIYPTLFIAYLTPEVRLQVELCRSYNRFMADRFDEAAGGFNWVVAMPTDSIEDCLVEMRFGKEHGAVGALVRGIEGDHSLADPYLFPIYSLASDLNLSICCHTGPGSAPLANMMDSRYAKTFNYNRMPPMLGFHDLCASKVPDKFPDVRWGFLEAGASFVPFIVHILTRYGRRFGGDPDYHGYGPDMFSAFNMYVACESDEDIPYLASYIGWDHLLLGTDYGHTDQSAELDLPQVIAERPDVSADQAKLMLEDNPATFYNLA